MAIAFRAESHSTFTTTLSPAVNAPSGLTDGDLIIVQFSCSSNAVVNSIISGWTQLGQTQDQSTDSTAIWLYKIANSEGSSWTFTDLFTDTETGVYGAICYSGVDATNPIDVTPVQSYIVYATAMTAGPITPVTDNCMLISMYCADPGSADLTATPDSTLPCTERIDTTEGATNGYVFIQDHLQTTATEETHEATASLNDGFAWMIVALRPGSGSGVSLSGESNTVSASIGVLHFLIELFGLSLSETFGAAEVNQLLNIAGQSSTLATAIGSITLSGLISLSGCSLSKTNLFAQIQTLLALNGISATKTIGNASLFQLASLIGKSSTKTNASSLIKQVASLIARAITKTSGTGELSILDLEVELSGKGLTASIARGIIHIIDTLIIKETYVSIITESELYISELSMVENYDSMLSLNELYDSLMGD